MSADPATVPEPTTLTEVFQYFERTGFTPPITVLATGIDGGFAVFRYASRALTLLTSSCDAGRPPLTFAFVDSGGRIGGFTGFAEDSPVDRLIASLPQGEPKPG